MNDFKNFKIFGTLEGSDKTIKLDEISIVANSNVVRALGKFFMNASCEMESNNVEHIHLQDLVTNFSYENHVDIILINECLVKIDNKK